MGVNLFDFSNDTFVLGEIEVDLDFLEGNASLGQVKSKGEWETFISTMYKRKDKKVLPVNIPLAHGHPPGGNMNGEAIPTANGEFKPTIVPPGSRLTPERLASMKIGTGFLTDSEKQLFIVNLQFLVTVNLIETLSFAYLSIPLSALNNRLPLSKVSHFTNSSRISTHMLFNMFLNVPIQYVPMHKQHFNMRKC